MAGYTVHVENMGPVMTFASLSAAKNDAREWVASAMRGGSRGLPHAWVVDPDGKKVFDLDNREVTPAAVKRIPQADIDDAAEAIEVYGDDVLEAYASSRRIVAEAKAEVARLRAAGWGRPDFARALVALLQEDAADALDSSPRSAPWVFLPGPYRAEIDKAGGTWRYLVRDGNPPPYQLGRQIAEVSPYINPFTAHGATPEAQVRLFAMAPRLHEAVTRMSPVVDPDKLDPIWLHEIRKMVDSIAPAVADLGDPS